MLTQDRLQRLLSYDADTGDFIRLVSRGSAVVGSVAGSFHTNGYRQIQIEGKRYYAHRLVWLYVHGRWPDDQIDHINGIKDDNRIENLREATHSENQYNRGALQNNKCGFKGVCWHKFNRRWRACIYKDGKEISLGYFDTPEEAHAAYCAAAEEHHGDFARVA